MFRKLVLAIAVAVLAAPLVARAQHDDDFDSDWGWIDQGDQQVEEYDFEPGQSVTIDTFQEGLSPYGQWVTVGAYGRVWRPAGVATGWRPYYNGNWEWTDEGWLWVSSEPWGWATYHYGRWAYDSFYGWVWVPGYQWAPAWVSWRFGPEYIGWAPLGPGLSVYVTNYPVAYDRWCFVPAPYFVGYPVHSHAYVGYARVAPIYARTQAAPPRASVHGVVAPAWGGPARPYVERHIGRPIAPVRVQAVATPRAAAAAPRSGTITVFRPEAARPSRGGAASRGAVQGGGRAMAPEMRSSPVAPGDARARPPASAGGVNAPMQGGARAHGSPGAAAVPPGGGAPPRNGGSATHAAPARPSAPAESGRGVESAPPPAPPRYHAPPARSSGGGSSAAPAPAPAPSRPSYGGGSQGGNHGGGNQGGNRGGGNQGGGSSGHAVPNRGR